MVAYEWLRQSQTGGTFIDNIVVLLTAAIVAGLLGYGAARAIAWAFPRGLVPEFLKGPVLLVAVIGTFVLAEQVYQETGLLTVTIMGMALANMRLSSARDFMPFKENVTVLLVSGVFVLLAASLDLETLQRFEWRFLAFSSGDGPAVAGVQPSAVAGTPAGQRGCPAGYRRGRNSLVCSEFAPEIGRDSVYQIGDAAGDDPTRLPDSLRGRALFTSGVGVEGLNRRQAQGWKLQANGAAEIRSDSQTPAVQDCPEADPLLILGSNGQPRFLTHASRPKPRAASRLDNLLKQPVIARGGCIVIRGHTDWRGSDRQNLRAPERHAELVAGYLVERGIAPDRLRVIALGERRPIAPTQSQTAPTFRKAERGTAE